MAHEQPTYDEVYAISDIHIGGQGDFQIFKDGQRLTWFINYIAHLSGERKIALVLNGDIVDFLADQDAKCFEPLRAVAKLEAVFDDLTFKNVWIALRDFVRTKNRTLILVLGNHDIELSLPAVTHRLLWELCSDDEPARGRIKFIFDNSGFSCSVARAQVLCVHGNEVDEYNIIDYEALRRVIVAINRGLDIPEMSHNAGTYLVVNVMNQIKKNYPFVDLLKPETKAALRLLALIGDETVRTTIGRFFDFFIATIHGQHAVREGRLGGETSLTAPTSERARAGLADLRNELLANRRAIISLDERLLMQAEADLDQDISPTDPLISERSTATLGGFATYLWDCLMGKDQDEAIREAMIEWLHNDHTFAVDEPDDQFQRLCATTSPKIDFLIAGHTHLARALRRPTGGYYFNSGTWSRLIELTPELLQDVGRFSEIIAAMRAHSMRALEQVPGLVLTRLTVVCLREVGGRAVGSLEEVIEASDGNYALASAQLRSRDGSPVGETRFIQE